MLIGLIKWFDKDKGFGVVENPIEGEFSLHINNFINKPEKISKGMAIIFRQKIDQKRSKNIADDCRLVGELNDWKIIMNLLGKRDIINIEIEAIDEGNRVYPYLHMETNPYSLKNFATKQLFKGKSEDEIFDIIINYFDSSLDMNLFISYCEFIENRINNMFKKNASIMLSSIYKYFGDNINDIILFNTWKNKAFKFIAFNEYEDYQIPESILKTYSSKIGLSELRRIKDYEYGSNFCNEFVISKFNNISNLSFAELKTLYLYLNYAMENDRIRYKLELDCVFTENIIADLIEKADKLEPIKTIDGFNKYVQLKQIYNYQIGNEVKIKIDEAINQIIVRKSSDEFKSELWLKGIIDNVSFELISKTFFDTETKNDKRILILSKLGSAEQIELLNDFCQNNEWENSFNLLEDINNEKSVLSNIGYLEIMNKILGNFSFKIYNSVDRFKAIFSLKYLTDELRDTLRGRIKLERKEIKVIKIIEIFSELKGYQLIKDENHLIELLNCNTIHFSELNKLISILSNSCEISLFRKLISNNIVMFSSEEKIKLLEATEQKQEIAKVLIEYYFLILDKESSIELNSLIEFLKRKKDEVLSKCFLDKFHKELPMRYSTSIFELAFFSNHIEAQKHSYQHLIFNTENEIINFIDKVKTVCVSDEVKSTNRPLTNFIEFLSTTTNFSLTDDCKKFLEVNKGIVQCLSVKYLIFQFHNKALTKTKLLEILKSFHWTEISALLLIAFIEESNYTDKILLDKLNGIFKSHFEILYSQKFNTLSFLDNFTIRNILNSCNGRKFYDGELWEKNGVSRWYVTGKATIHTKESMNCYCEGKPWKKEFFWDSNTNRPLPEQHEKYWCKTNYCSARNDSVDLSQHFKDWKLSEISATLNISIEKNALATLAGWANRMNQIVEHLFCRNCKEVLRPLPFRPRTLGYYSVPLFHCINYNCTEKQTIRFTHCLNSKCESHKKSLPLDSRDCNNCRPNDPYHTGLNCIFCGSDCPACSGHNQRIISQDVW